MFKLRISNEKLKELAEIEEGYDISAGLEPITKIGWFCVCPVYFRELDMTLGPRHKIFCPIFELMMILHNSMLFIASVLNIDIDCGYPIKITGTK